jgi:hypothetical protein
MLYPCKCIYVFCFLASKLLPDFIIIIIIVIIIIITIIIIIITQVL